MVSATSDTKVFPDISAFKEIYDVIALTDRVKRLKKDVKTRQYIFAVSEPGWRRNPGERPRVKRYWKKQSESTFRRRKSTPCGGRGCRTIMAK
jgi:hypothetical protein